MTIHVCSFFDTVLTSCAIGTQLVSTSSGCAFGSLLHTSVLGQRNLIYTDFFADAMAKAVFFTIFAKKFYNSFQASNIRRLISL
jgi:hypothetical protein